MVVRVRGVARALDAVAVGHRATVLEGGAGRRAVGVEGERETGVEERLVHGGREVEAAYASIPPSFPTLLLVELVHRLGDIAGPSDGDQGIAAVLRVTSGPSTHFQRAAVLVHGLAVKSLREGSFRVVENTLQHVARSVDREAVQHALEIRSVDGGRLRHAKLVGDVLKNRGRHLLHLLAHHLRTEHTAVVRVGERGVEPVITTVARTPAW